jgi:hypothetical protein
MSMDNSVFGLLALWTRKSQIEALIAIQAMATNIMHATMFNPAEAFPSVDVDKLHDEALYLRGVAGESIEALADGASPIIFRHNVRKILKNAALTSMQVDMMLAIYRERLPA